VPTYYPGVIDPSSASVIDVAAGRDVAGITIPLRRSAVFHIRGTVSGSIPSEIARPLRISVGRTGDASMFTFSRGTFSGKNGTFDIGGIAPGSYSLFVMNSQGLIRVFARQPVQVGNRDLENVALVVQPTGTLPGSVKVEPSSAQATMDLGVMGVQFTNSGSTTMPPNTRVKSDGTFTLEDVGPDKYGIRVSGSPEGTYLKAARMGDVDILTNDLDLTAGVRAGLIEITLSATAGQIDGTVQDDQQKTSPGALVTLIPDPADTRSANRYKFATTDQNGQFSIKSLSPGKYKLYAWEDIENGNQYDPDFMKPLEGLGFGVTVEENGRQAAPLKLITASQVEKAQGK
jgi:uncharacterized protein (DUF2141 family)